MPDTVCVLIAQETAGERLSEIARTLRNRDIPFAVLTEDGSDENQVRLLDFGVQNIFVLPMSAVLLQKRVTALCGSAGGGSEAGFDLFAQIAESDDRRGAFSVRESDFPNVYRFVLRLQERSEKLSQMVLFRFHGRLNMELEPGTLENVFPLVQKCLRRGDIVCIYGNEIIAILIGADEEGGKGAADRIIATYDAYYCNSPYSMNYEIRTVS